MTMKILKLAMLAWGTGATLLALVVTTPTPALASPSASAPAAHVVSQAPIAAGSTRAECLTPNFDNTGPTALQAAVASFDSLTNSTVTCISAYLDSAVTWSDWTSPWVTNPTYGYTSWVAQAPSTRQLVLQVDLIPTSLEDVSDPLGWEQSCAAGDFNAYATELGTNLVAAGLQNSVLRLGAEMNGTWEVDFMGTTTQEQNLWAACFANEVTALRQATGQHFLIDWDPNACKGAYPYADFYPGNSYVDVVGLDLYDVDCDSPTTPVNFSSLDGEPFGLADFEAFADSQGKPMSLPEWGLATVPSSDDPGYVDGIAATVAEGNFAFESYFDGGGGTNSKSLALTTSTPLSLAAYQSWYGTPSVTAAPVSGAVTSTGGSSLAGICVEAFLNGTDLAASAATAADGTYTILGLAPGAYGVEFLPGCGGGDYATQWFNGTGSGTPTAPGTMVSISSSPVTGIDATMSPGTSISGAVSAATGGVGLEGICVDAIAVGGTDLAASAATTAGGTYTLEGLVPGSYDVEFLAGSCGGDYVTNWYDGTSTGASSVSGASAVSVSVASPALGVNAAMVLGATIEGTVSATVSGAAVANVCLSIVSTSGGIGGSTVSSADGIYTISELAADTYHVAADPTCGGTVTSAYASPQPSVGTAQVATGQTVTSDAGLVRRGSITDVITPSAGAPTNAVVGGVTYSPSATATSGDQVVIALDGASTGCVLNAGVVSFTAVGTCLVDFNDPTFGPSDAYTSAAQVQLSIDVVASLGGGGGAGGGAGGSGGGGSGGSGGSVGGTSSGPPVIVTPTTPTGPPAPSESAPTPREVTYSAGSTSLSSKAQRVLDALVKRLSAGSSITVVGYARDNAALARTRAEVVARFLAKHVSLRVIIRVVLTSSVNKVMVITTRE